MCFMVLVNRNNPGHNLVWPHYKIKKIHDCQSVGENILSVVYEEAASILINCSPLCIVMRGFKSHDYIRKIMSVIIFWKNIGSSHNRGAI